MTTTAKYLTVTAVFDGEKITCKGLNKQIPCRKDTKPGKRRKLQLEYIDGIRTALIKAGADADKVAWAEWVTA